MTVRADRDTFIISEKLFTSGREVKRGRARHIEGQGCSAGPRPGGAGKECEQKTGEEKHMAKRKIRWSCRPWRSASCFLQRELVIVPSPSWTGSRPARSGGVREAAPGVAMGVTSPALSRQAGRRYLGQGPTASWTSRSGVYKITASLPGFKTNCPGENRHLGRRLSCST